MTVNEILAHLKGQSNPANVEEIARFGINPDKTLGISMPFLRKLARTIGRDHQVALDLYDLEYMKPRSLPLWLTIRSL
jgi:3-methyladenine DNA glycosylase AlkD